MNTWLQIDAKALVTNLQIFRELSKGSIICPIIKSNAYGHGIAELYSILKNQHCEWLGVNYINEGRFLREKGFKGNILVVGPCFSEELKEAASLRLDIIVGHNHLYKSWLEEKNKPRIHLKIDTGMSRQGFYLPELKALEESLKSFAPYIKGVCSHFANVEDVNEYSYPKKQQKEFEVAFQYLDTLGIRGFHHLASSASSLIMPETKYSLIRLGISLYGFWPSKATKLSYSNLHDSLLPLEPVLSWYSKVVQIKKVPKGNFIGYGCTYRAPSDTCIAVIPVGYYEGYPRLASDNSHSYLLIRGNRCRILGRICMNMMMVEISHVQSCQVGDLVTLIGKDGDERIQASDIGDWSQTIHYEIVSKINPSLKRIICND